MSFSDDVRALLIDVARRDFTAEPPAGALERILAERAAGNRVVLPVDAHAPRAVAGASAAPVRARQRSTSRSSLTIALLLGAAGVAAALPGSPVRRWLMSATTREANAPRAAAPVVAPRTAAPEAPDTAVAGISIPVQAEPILISVDATAPFRIRVRVTDGDAVEVRGTGVAAHSVFRSRSDGVSISEVAGGELQVDVPRSAARIVLRVGGVTYLAKTGSRMEVRTAADTIGGEILFDARPDGRK